MWYRQLWTRLAAWKDERAAARRFAVIARRPGAHLLRDVGLDETYLGCVGGGFIAEAALLAEPAFQTPNARSCADKQRLTFTVIEGGKPVPQTVELSKAG